MKKLLALLMALMMCCTAFAFAEEEAEVPAVEMNVSFEAQTVALGETGLTMQIPADWAVQEVPAGTENAENILLFAVNADQTVSITAQLSAMSFKRCCKAFRTRARRKKCSLSCMSTKTIA